MAWSRSPSPLFALLVGIDRYRHPSIVNLCGAVNDANAVEDFLISEVGVSKDRIVILRDEEATREAILKAMRDLARHSAIHVQDPILIYYAGHGGENPLPAGSGVGGLTGRVLLPHDFGCKGLDTKPAVQGIFDTTLSEILVDIAARKSDNIVESFLFL